MGKRPLSALRIATAEAVVQQTPCLLLLVALLGQNRHLGLLRLSEWTVTLTQ
jgi:hypothetical protein